MYNKNNNNMMCVCECIGAFVHAVVYSKSNWFASIKYLQKSIQTFLMIMWHKRKIKNKIHLRAYARTYTDRQTEMHTISLNNISEMYICYMFGFNLIWLYRLWMYVNNIFVDLLLSKIGGVEELGGSGAWLRAQAKEHS